MSRACRPRPSLSQPALQAIADRLNREWPVPAGWTDWHVNGRRVECNGNGCTVIYFSLDSDTIGYVSVWTGCIHGRGFETPRQAWEFAAKEAAECPSA